MRYLNVLWVMGLLFAATSCDSGFECGEGTVEMDGICVPEGGVVVMCGPGTTLDAATGNCLPDGVTPTECGTGTTFNMATNECEPDISGCATGTVAMGGECVPDGSVICDDGTVFDMTTGTCMPDADACGEGTVLIDGECRPSDEALMGEVFAAAEPDDPLFFDGTPADFLPPAIGEERTIEGCITPDDFDADGETDFDVDYFAFTVANPGLFRINADGLGGLAAGFAVLAIEGPLADRGWIRVGLNLTGDSSERQVYLPRGGSYVLAVFDSRSLNLDTLETNGVAFQRVAGSADTCYFVTVEALALPTPTALAGLTRSGTLGDPEFYTVPATGRTVYEATMSETSFAADGAFVLVAGTTPTESAPVGADDFALSAPVADGENLLVVVDNVFNYSLDPVDYELELAVVAQVPDDGVVTITNDADSPTGNLLALDATAGDVVHVTYSSADSIAVGVFPPDLSAGFRLPAATDRDFYFVVGQTGSQAVSITNDAAADGEDFDVTFTIGRQTPPTLAGGTLTNVVLADTRTFVRVNATSFEWARMDVGNFMGTGLVGADIDFFTDDGSHAFLASPGITDQSIDSEAGVTDSFARIYGPTFGPMVLVSIEDDSGTFDGDESLDVTFGTETFFDETVAPGADVTRTGDAIPAGESIFYFVRGTPAGELTFTATGTGGTDPVIDLLDAEALSTLTRDTITGADTSENLTRRVTSAGFFALAVSNAGGAAGTVDVTITQLAPPYSSGAGTTSFASICPDMGGTGTDVTTTFVEDFPGLPLGDEAITPTVAFTTFTGFEFFGAPATGYRISSNGWVTFDTTTTLDNSRFLPDPIGDTDDPNNIIAAFWRDLVSSQICVLEEASRMVIEFNGTGYDFFGADAPYGSLQMQVILLASTGTIELVYGPGHDLEVIGPEGVTATVGVENDDGTIGIPASLDPAASSSILFTPAP